MELLMLIAVVVLLALSVLSYRLTSRRSPAPPLAPALAAGVHKITDADIAHSALVENADAFTERPVFPFFVNLAKRRGGQYSENINTMPYGPQWRALRCNLTSETLHPSRLGLCHLAPLQREAIQDLVAALSAGGTGLIRDHLRAAVFRVMARLCFGDGVDGRQVRTMCFEVHGMQVAIGEINLSPTSSMLAKLAKWRHQRQLLAFHARITDLCLPLIAAARWRHDEVDVDVRRPYVDSLIQLRVPEGGGGRRALRDDEIVNLLMELLGAGMGTSAVCLEWTLAHLVDQPDVQEKLRREVHDGDSSQMIRGMPYLHAVILESLRMHPPVPLALRHVQADAAATLVGGGERETNSDLIVMFILGDMGRDDKKWKDPDEFRPERFLPGGEAESVGPLPGPKETRMMPFGAGHRFCPGVGLAMVILKSFLAALVREFEWAPPTDAAAAVDLTELDGFMKTMKKPLSARLTQRTY